MDTVYLNGRFLPRAEALVPAMDRGFLFGDGVYEVVPIFGGRCFRRESHLDRLGASLAATRIPQPLSRAAWRRLIDRLVQDCGAPDQSVYLQVTRGVTEVREHRFSPDMAPTVFAMTRAIPEPPELPEPIACITLEDIRWARCDIKSTSLLAGVLLSQQAQDAGAREAVLVRDGLLTEGATSNVFAVFEGALYTAPKGPHILGGITRDLLVELARKRGLGCREESLPAAALPAVEELWISSSTREMIPVTRLDGRAVGSGEIGPVYRRLWGWYREWRRAYGARAPRPA